jgi:hypothetical protein
MKICSNSRELEFTFRLNLFVAMTHHILHRAKRNTKCKREFFRPHLHLPCRTSHDQKVFGVLSSLSYETWKIKY